MSSSANGVVGLIFLYQLGLLLVAVLIAIGAGAKFYGFTRVFHGILLTFAAATGGFSFYKRWLIPVFAASVGTYYVTNSVVAAVGVYAVAGLAARWLKNRRRCQAEEREMEEIRKRNAGRQGKKDVESKGADAQSQS